MKQVFRFFLVMSFLFVFTTHCSKQEAIVARVGNESITLKEFKDDFSKGKSFHMIQNADREALVDHLNKMIEKRVMVQVAYQMGLDKDSTLQEKVKAFQMRVLNPRLFQVEIEERVVRESMIRDFYLRGAKQVTIHDLLFDVSQDAHPDDDKAAKENAEKAYKKLMNGENIFSVANELVTNEKFKRRSAIIRDLEWDTNQDPIRKQAWNMQEGDVSNVIRNSRGYHVFKVAKIMEKKLPDYESDKIRIKKILVKENQGVLTQKADSYLDKLAVDNGFEIDENELNWLIQKLHTFSSNNTITLPDSIQAISHNDRERILATFDQGHVTVEDVIFQLLRFHHSQIAQMANEQILKNFIRNSQVSHWLLTVALKKGLYKEKEIAKRLEDNLNANLIQLVKDRLIFNNVQKSDAAVREYYEKNKAVKYSTPEQVKVQEVKVNNEELANKIIKWAKAGQSMNNLVMKYSQRTGYKNKKGIMTITEKNKSLWGKLGDAVFSLETGDISGPIDLGGEKGFSIIKVLEKMPSEIKPFDEVKSRVENDYRAKKEEELEKEWLDEQKKKVNIQIFEEILVSAFHPKES